MGEYVTAFIPEYIFRRVGQKRRRWDKKLTRLVIVAHSLAASALIVASVVAVRFVGVLPWWFGVLTGVLLYALTLFVAKADDGDEEAP